MVERRRLEVGCCVSWRDEHVACGGASLAEGGRKKTGAPKARQ